MIGVYKITSPTNRVYIGSSNDISNRWCSYKNLKCTSQIRLYRSLKKYGVENHMFEVLEECNIEHLLERERYYGELFSVLSTKGLNCRLPKIEDSDNCLSKETKAKIGLANRGRLKGYKFGHYESKLKSLSVEQITKVKKLLVENKLTQNQIGKIFNVSRKTISNINIGKTYNTLSKEVDLLERRKMYIKLNKNDYSMIHELKRQGKSQSEIARHFNVTQSHISRIINDENYIKSLKSNS